jgi:DNA-binding transcriptional LysR family regulator
MAATNGLDLNDVDTFVRVVDAGSLTAAARTLGLPKSSVAGYQSTLPALAGVSSSPMRVVLP